MRAAALFLSLMLCGRAQADEALVKHLLVEINKIPYVDSHIHLAFPDPKRKEPYDVQFLLSSATYVAEFTYGKDWPDMKKALAINAHHAYYRPILEALRDLYGMAPDEELNDGNVERISKAMNAAHKRPGYYEEVFDIANLAHLVDLDGGDRGQSEMPGPRWHSMWNIDGLVYLDGFDKKAKAWSIDSTQKHFKVTLKDLAQMEKLITEEISAYFKRGGVGLKSTSAYFRKLNFDLNVKREDAEAAFTKVLAHQELDEKERKTLQDFLMLHVLDTVNLLKKPIQFHTGNQQNWNIVENSNPLELNNLFYSGRFSEARFVLLHGGYPYTQESITLARYYKPTVSLDLAWMALFSPAAAKATLSQAMDMLDGTQLMFGTDTANLEEMYGCIKFTRRIMAEVCAEKIESGFWTEPVALQAARRVLYQNAVDMYGLDPKH